MYQKSEKPTSPAELVVKLSPPAGVFLARASCPELPIGVDAWSMATCVTLVAPEYDLIINRVTREFVGVCCDFMREYEQDAWPIVQTFDAALATICDATDPACRPPYSPGLSNRYLRVLWAPVPPDVCEVIEERRTIWWCFDTREWPEQPPNFAGLWFSDLATMLSEHEMKLPAEWIVAPRVVERFS